MRIERKGKIEPLTPKWQRFLVEALGATSLDDLQSPEDLRADYACLSGLIAVELKTLEEDASERMDNLTDELRKRADWPMFIGSAPFQAITKHMENPEAVRLQIVNRMGRAIINHLKKANKQLAAHAKTFPRKNLVRVVLMINEDHEIYEPLIVAYIVQHALKRRDENGALLYPHIDSVIYTSERHATQIQGMIAFPIVSIEAPGLEFEMWKRSVIDIVLQRWSVWNGIPQFDLNPRDGLFSTIEHVPNKMPRHERWRLDYRRDPYMKHIDNAALRDRFDEAQVVLTLMGLKNAPIKPPHEAIEQSFILFTHVIMEMGERGITAPEFAMEPARLAAAARRLSAPDIVVRWFETDMGRA